LEDTPGRLSKLQAHELAATIVDECRLRGRNTLALVAQIERPLIGAPEWDGPEGEIALQTLARRVSQTLREVDAAFSMGDERVVAIVAPMRRVDLDIALSLADRMQAAIAEPIVLSGRTVRLECRIGLCSDKMSVEPTGGGLLSGANVALAEAMRHEIGAVRAFTQELHLKAETGHRLTLQVEEAIEVGQIKAWFQPQVEAKTGRLCGFEALARWHHPELGILSPHEFLPAITASGNDGALGERMLRQALEALELWDDAGLSVDQVGLNFSLHELRDPRLAERVIWEVDRAGVPTSRIAVEILETVTLEDAEETITRNIRLFKDAGMRIDLDDFGTGSASISNIARFGVHRIKIDRSFVRDLERSPEKRRTLSAIISMADEMGIETLAEGVESEAQIAQLAADGCTHLQGFGIAKPMPLEETLIWSRDHLPKSVGLALLRPHGTA
jgi:EAL domain-containing protein (putative c-di-GMP-specific phosphodiesterase class I)